MARRTGNETVSGDKYFTGNVLMTGAGAIGYGAGSGGSVTQITSKATDVTLNKLSGRIITTPDNLAAGAYVSFTFNNSNIASGDIVFVQATGGVTGKEYQAWVSYSATGVCIVNLRNNSASGIAAAVGIDFVIFKRAAS